jgi:hypothetical protein
MSYPSAWIPVIKPVTSSYTISTGAAGGGSGATVGPDGGLDAPGTAPARFATDEALYTRGRL